MKSQKTTVVTESGYYPRYVHSGHVVFLRAGDLWAAPFDVETLAVTGPEKKIREGVDSQPLLGFGAS